MAENKDAAETVMKSLDAPRSEIPTHANLTTYGSAGEYLWVSLLVGLAGLLVNILCEPEGMLPLEAGIIGHLQSLEQDSNLRVPQYPAHLPSPLSFTDP